MARLDTQWRMRWRKSLSWPSWYCLPTPRISTACSDEVGKAHLHAREQVPAEEHQGEGPGTSCDDGQCLDRRGEQAPARQLDQPGEWVDRDEGDDVRGLSHHRVADRREERAGRGPEGHQ